MAAKTDTTVLAALAAHDERLATVTQRARSIATDIQTATGDIQKLTADRVGAFAADDEDAARRAEATRAKVEATLTDLQERHAGAELGARRAEADRDKFTVDNIHGLIRELTPPALAIRDQLKAKIAEVEQLAQAWHQAEARLVTLLRPVPNIDGRDVPTIDAVDGYVRDLAAAAHSLPAPLPRGIANTASIPAHDDPDDDVREAARARMIAKEAT